MIIYDPKITGSFDVNGTSISSLDQIDVTSGSVSSLNDATSSYALIAEISGSTTSLSSSLASELLKNTTDTLTGDLTVTGTLTAQDLHVQEVTSSIVFSSGSNKFGSLSSDTQLFTGSLQVSGSTNYLLGNVGIGTDSPGSHLEVYGTAAKVRINNTTATNTDLTVLDLTGTVQGSGTGNERAILLGKGTNVARQAKISYLQGSSNGQLPSLAFYTGDNVDSLDERMRITSAGSVGIGTTTISKTLTINGEIFQKSRLNLQRGSAGATTLIQFLNEVGSDRAHIDFGGTNEELSFFAGDGTTSHMHIKADGTIGVGTSNPLAKMDIHMSDSNGTYGRGKDGNLNLENTNTANTEGGWMSISGYMGNTTSQYQMGMITGGKVSTAGDGNYGGYLSFWTTSGGANSEANSGAYERMRVDDQGRVGIGTNSPEDKLHVYGQIKADQIKTRSFSSLSGSPSSGDWFPIGTISDTNPSIVTYYIKTYAHSSIAFTVSEGYSADNRGHVQIIDHTYSANGGYANVSGVRIRQNGVVEIKLVWSSGPSVNIKITAVGVQAPEISTSLAATTETATIVDTIDVSGNYGMMRAAGNILAQGDIRVGTTSSNALVTVKGGGNPVGIGDEYGHTGIKFYGSTSGQLELFNNRGNSTYGNTIFTNSSGERMRINASGHVGIANSNPQFELCIGAADAPNRNMLEIAVNSSDTGTNIIQNYNRATAAYTPLNIAASIMTFGVGSTATERMRIDSNGEIGIGTNNPGTPLHIYGSTGTQLRLQNTVNSLYTEIHLQSQDGSGYIWRAASGYNGSQGGANALNIYNTGGGMVSIGTNTGNNALNVNGGSVGIGTTSPGDKLDVNGRIRARSNDGNTTAYIARTFEFGHPGNTGNFTRTFNVEDDLGYNRRGGAVTIIAHTWTNEHQFGIISWNNAGGADNLTTVAYNSISSAGDFSISVAVNSANDNTIDVTFSNAHSNSHGWHAYLQGMF